LPAIILSSLDDAGRSQAAQSSSYRLSRVLAMAVGYSIDLNSYLLLMEEIICGWSKWANYREADAPNAVIVTMHHNYGLPWSLFISEFVFSPLKCFVTPAQMGSIELGASKSGVITCPARPLGLAVPVACKGSRPPSMLSTPFPSIPRLRSPSEAFCSIILPPPYLSLTPPLLPMPQQTFFPSRCLH